MLITLNQTEIDRLLTQNPDTEKDGGLIRSAGVMYIIPFFEELYSSLPRILFLLAYELGLAKLSRFRVPRFRLGPERQNLVRSGVQRLGRGFAGQWINAL